MESTQTKIYKPQIYTYSCRFDLCSRVLMLYNQPATFLRWQNSNPEVFVIIIVQNLIKLIRIFALNPILMNLNSCVFIWNGWGALIDEGPRIGTFINRKFNSSKSCHINITIYTSSRETKNLHRFWILQSNLPLFHAECHRSLLQLSALLKFW